MTEKKEYKDLNLEELKEFLIWLSESYEYYPAFNAWKEKKSYWTYVPVGELINVYLNKNIKS